MTKSYRRKTSGKRVRRTRKAGGMFDSLKTHMDKGAAEANKHYEAAKKAAAPHAEKMKQQSIKGFAQAKSFAAPHVENMQNKTTQLYNKQKYSNPTSFAAAKMGERYGKSMMTQGNAMMSQYHPSGMTTGNVGQAMESSRMGVPQASPYSRQ